MKKYSVILANKRWVIVEWGFKGILQFTDKNNALRQCDILNLEYEGYCIAMHRGDGCPG